MPKNEVTYIISSATLADVRDFLGKKNYPAAYQAIADDLKAQAARGVKIDQNTLTWYTDAAQINNANATSFIHYFARDYVSDYARLTIGKTIDNDSFQKISDELAVNILSKVLKNDRIQSFSKVGLKDTKNIVTGFNVDQYAWPAYADLASFSWLRSFKNPTWLTNLTIKNQRNILFATRQAGEAALLQSRGNGLTLSDIVNSISLENKLLSIKIRPTLGARRAPAGLRNKFSVKILYDDKAQSQPAASPKRASAHMQLHSILMQSRSNLRSFAPPPGHLAHMRGTQPVRIPPHRAPPPTRASSSASFVPKIYHDPTGNLPPGFSEYLRRLSRLPPSGGTAFDPRLTPTWAGLKLPG